MRPRTLTAALMAAAILLLAVGLVAEFADLLGETAVDAVALAGLGLLAVAQGIRAAVDRSPRSLVVLLLVLALIVVVLVD